MIRITQYFIRTIKPYFFSILTRLIYSGSRVVIGKNFRTDSVPRIIVDRACRVIICDNVEFRRNIEIRVHNESQLYIGSEVRIDRGVRLLSSNHSNLYLSDGCRIGLYTVFNGGDSITIGKKVLISGYVYIQTSMHNYERDTKIQEQGFRHKSIILEDDVWVGTHVVIMPGCTIGKGSVVGSNAVVTKSFGENLVIGGIPAIIIKER